MTKVTSADNTDNTARRDLEPIREDELIDDRALARVEDDEFRLGDFVTDLAQRCRVSPTPANIALYGAWGSGKTSLGNLLEAEFKSDRVVTFGRFDAFKYAEVPLRRHFLSRVAASFGIGNKKFSDDLYESIKTQRFRLTKRSLLELGGAIIAASIVLALVMAVAAVVISLLALHVKSFSSTFVSTLQASAPGIVIAVPIIAALLAIAFRRFEIEVTSSAPSSDEQFEKLFIELVVAIKDKTKRSRVVIFIDELDRCSPKQVGSVLETLRTFLDVDSCIFIVAADQQALEHALTEGGARQATPADSTNPYYSSGNAYLDKIFHYQLPLPPLLPRRLSQFAYKLIENKTGVWQRVPNRAELVSVLVPTHIRSPRRVKTLLNTFASLYRLAIRRGADDDLDGNVEARASEIAKLVCLRTEFPLFARDLSLDARLPKAVLALVANPKLTLAQLAMPGLSHEAYEKAKAYATGTLPVADLLARKGEEPQQTPATDGDSSPERGAADEDEVGLEDVQRSYGQQLIRYLERTRTIAGPGRDLVYLESSGAAFGLPAELADRLEVDALDGRGTDVAAQIESLAPAEQLASYRLLAQLVVEGTVGLETANVTGSLFAALDVATTDLAPVANDVLSAISNYSGTYELAADDLSGALRLALASDGVAAHEVRDSVLARDEVIAGRDLGMVVLEHASVLPPATRGRVSEVLAARIADTVTSDVVAALADMPDALAVELIRSLPEPAVEEPEPAPATPAVAAAEATEEEPDPETVFANDLRELAEALVDGERPVVAGAVFDRLLTLDTQAGRNNAVAIISRFDPIADAQRVKAIFTSLERRYVREWPTWLQPITAETLDASVEDQRTFVLTATITLWNKRFSAGTDTPATAEEFGAAAAEIVRITKSLPLPSDRGIRDLLSGTAPSAVTTEPEATIRSAQYEALRSLAASGLISPSLAADAVLSDVGTTLVAAVPAAAPNPIAAWAYEASARALGTAGPDAIQLLVEALDASAWIDESDRSVIKMLAVSALREQDSSITSPLTSGELANLLAAGTPGADVATAAWIEKFHPDAADLLTAVRPTVDGGRLTQPLRSSLSALADEWSEGDKADLLEALAPAFVEGQTPETLFREVRVSGADPDRAVATLTGLFQASVNNDRRNRVLRLWGIVQPSSKKAQRALVDDIFVPLIGGGKGQVKLALDNFALVANVGKPTQAKIKQALNAAAAGEDELQKSINKVLQGVQWIKRPRKWGVFG